MFNSKNTVNILSKIIKIVPKKDLVTLICYETKWRGGEAISKLKAVDSALAPILDELKSIGLKINNNLYLIGSKKAKILQDKIDKIC